ncbi:hypothetical protein [Arthrobacter sp. Marseille-P9274]|uniref:hypothetical protein n=1 Tax=Arthrobacter sp. Marseille-P9274 TaxID=2866572 RepID=UPI0021C80817|nr:hypothetical protein [Arthrobacter sp. Marseille-P9274]
MIETSAARRTGPLGRCRRRGFPAWGDGSFVTGSDLLIDGGVIAAMRNEESAAR